MSNLHYDDCVFLNVPFDIRYEPLLRALVFTVHDCGFVARCAREIDNSGLVRLEKIYDLIAEAKYGIHDISRTSLDRANRLPRFNMPLELGIFLGARRFGKGPQQEKFCLILDRDPFRYQKFCSDLAGQDIRAHGGQIEGAIRGVRNWLSSQLVSQEIQVPGYAKMLARYQRFQGELPAICARLQLESRHLIYNEYATLVVGWLKANPWTPQKAEF